MAGSSEGVKKAWLKRKRKGKKVSVREAGRGETSTTLEKGATIKEVAKKWGVSIKELIQLNGITSPTQIKAGMSLKIPAILSRKDRELKATTKAIETNKKRLETAAKPKKTKKKKS